jgi:single-stranded-DNA-specific exonuclease
MAAEKKWISASPDPQLVAELQASLGINAVLCRLLVNREVRDYEAAKNFFRPSLSHLYSPWLMKDMEAGVSRIMDALDAQEGILVLGDYDVDGTTSVAMVYEFLNDLETGTNIEFYIPNRYVEGYGISKKGIDYAHSQGMSLIIALDCGIKSVELIAYAKQLGIDFIVCDHHLPEAELPLAVAILNPKQHGCEYPYKELCGCGVGFKLITALAETLGLPSSSVEQYLDLVATAIAADLVPMTGENRVLTWFGLKQLNENPRPGLHALKEKAGVKKEQPLTITDVVFIIAPRINAAGRMDDAKKAVLLFIEKDETTAIELAAMLHSDNSDRKDSDHSITREALALMEQDNLLLTRKSTVLYQPHWHKGVVGIVASRLIEKYYRPTIVLTQSGEMVSGSARSVKGFNLYEAIHACRDYLVAYGGHFAAAGLTLHPHNVEPFVQKFEEVVAATIGEISLLPEIHIDSEIQLPHLKESFYKIITQMEPFGPGNSKPIFLLRNITGHNWSKVAKDQHIQFFIQQDGINIKGIGFGMADKFSLLEAGMPIDLVFCIDQDEWNGEKKLQLKVIDIRRTES